MTSSNLANTAIGAATGPIGAAAGALYNPVKNAVNSAGGIGGALDSFGRYITGTVDPNQQANLLSQVQGPQQSTYQIGGMQDYQNTMQGLGNQVPGAQDFQGANADQMGNQAALQNYFQNVAMGKQPTQANQMFQNAQAQAGQQLQSGMLSQGGMNPALGQRQMANAQAGRQGQLASQSAAQSYAQQQQAAQFAQAGSQAMVQQRMAQMNANYNEQMQGIQAKSDIANRIWDSNRQQTSLNVDYAQNRSAYQQFMYGQQMQSAQQQAAAHAALFKMLLNAGVQGGAAAMTGGGSLAAGAAKNAMSSGMGDMSGGAPGSFNEGATNPYMGGPTDAGVAPTLATAGSEIV